MVRVNFLGQYIYDNQIVGEQELKAGLTKALQAAARESRELTLTVAADEQVKWDALIRLAQWAREAGIKDAILAEWLDKPSASPARPVP
jgi:biopolymer transport protein ExbD